MTIRQVAVYAASSEKVAQIYFSATQELANILVQNNIRVVYGGGSVGLMGCLADTVIAEKGYIKGIIPEFMRKVEWQHNGLNDLEIVADMHERKSEFLRKTDAVIALPGGCGTLEELLEVITWKRLGVFLGPIVIINTDGFYDPLIEMLKKCIREKFMNEQHESIWSIIESPSQIMDAFANAKNWSDYKIEQAKA